MVLTRCAVSGAEGGHQSFCVAVDEFDDPHQDVFVAAAVGTFVPKLAYQAAPWRRTTMDGIIYLVGLIVIILAILSFFGLR